MFNFFRRREPTIPTRDKVWTTSANKLDAAANAAISNSNILFLFWFEESMHAFEEHLKSRNVNNANYALTAHSFSNPAKHNIIFAEHYPLREKETKMYERLQLKEAEVWSALDEPLFKLFGGERIVDLMRRLGMNDGEFIQHQMISSSIGKAQEKLAKTVVSDHHANSQEDWFRYHKASSQGH